MISNHNNTGYSSNAQCLWHWIWPSHDFCIHHSTQHSTAKDRLGPLQLMCQKAIKIYFPFPQSSWTFDVNRIQNTTSAKCIVPNFFSFYNSHMALLDKHIYKLSCTTSCVIVMHSLGFGAIFHFEDGIAHTDPTLSVFFFINIDI